MFWPVDSSSLQGDVRLAEKREEVGGAGLLELVAYQQIYVHPDQQQLDPAERTFAQRADGSRLLADWRWAAPLHE